MTALVLALSLSLSVSWAGALVRPAAHDPVRGECARSIPLRVGEPIPAELVDGAGLVKCAAVAEPVSRVVYMLAVERHRDALEDLHALDIRLLESERDWYRARYVAASGPPPWYERPSVQRWTGRLEALLTVAVVGAGIGAVYNQREGV